MSLDIGCKEYLFTDLKWAVDMGTVQMWAGEMRYRLDIGFRDGVRTGNWLQRCRNGYSMDKGNTEEVQIGHGMWRLDTD